MAARGGNKNRGIPRTPKNIQYGELKQPFILRWLRSSHPDAFLEKGVPKICSKFFFFIRTLSLTYILTTTTIYILAKS